MTPEQIGHALALILRGNGKPVTLYVRITPGMGSAEVTHLIPVGQTDAERSRLGSYGDPGAITCYSGGEQIYVGHSTGKIQANSALAGFEFRESGSNKFIRTNADCVVSN